MAKESEPRSEWVEISLSETSPDLHVRLTRRGALTSVEGYVRSVSGATIAFVTTARRFKWGEEARAEIIPTSAIKRIERRG
ncbi:MAG: hypothetical protein KGI73_01050 [Patescibacteria group bacterium]|nr:hypothetical protein [Patescibacteria group bacterium]